MSNTAETATQPVKIARKKSLGRLDIFLGIICLILFLDTVAPAAAMGPTAITWYLIIAIVYFIPASLIAAELGAAYPDEGGMYTWVKRGLGNRWGARVSWYYWLNNALWVPSVTIFIAQVFAQLFMPDLGLTPMIIMAICLTWVYVFIGMRPMKESKWVTNIGAGFKLTIVAGIIISAVIFLVKNGGVPANDLSIGNFVPTLGASFLFFPALIYNMNGCEAICSMGSQMKNPAKDVPKTIIAAALLVTGIYCFCTLAILAIMPYEDMDIVQGLLNCFIFALGDGALANAVVMIVGLLFLYTLIAQGPVWMVSACTMASEASQNGELPKAFGILHKKHQSPVGSLVLIGIISTIITVVYGFMATNAADLFWTLFSFTSIIFFLPYIIDFSAFIRLRKNDPDTPRPYRFPGGDKFAFFVCRLGQFVLLFTIVAFFWVPGQPIDWGYSIPLIIGVIIFLVVGEILNHTSMKKAGLLK
ncbi:MAG: APC family permease [Clostridiales bacterium]